MKRRVTWIHLTQHAQVIAVDDKTLTLGFSNSGARDSFVNGGSPEIVRQAAIDVVGTDWKVDAIVDPSAHAAPAASGAHPAEPHRGSAAEEGGLRRVGDPVHDAAPRPAAPATDEPVTQAEPPVAAAREAIQATRPAGGGGKAPAANEDLARADAAAHPDDADAENNGLAGTELLQRELGAQVIEEIRHD
jgi:DNA polymerase-3 subunit gamma/tau